MDVTVVVGTYGTDAWQDLARVRAIPSAADQADVVHVHGPTLHEARNAGAQEARTEWLCFLDGDDELSPGYIDAMAAGTADLRGPSVMYIRRGRPSAPRVWPPMNLEDGNYLVIGTLVRRDMFLKVGGFKDWPLYEDWCLWQRCHLAGATIETIPAAVYRAHVRADSRNRAPSREERGYWHETIRQANYPWLYREQAA